MEKKLFVAKLILLMAMCWNSSECFGQTYAYRHIYTVDENGVKSAPTNGIVYITFTNDMAKFYPSDENGIQKSYGDIIMGFGTVGVCKYIGKVNDKYKYTIDTSVNKVPYSGGYDPYGVERLKNTFSNNWSERLVSVRKKVGGIYRFSTDFKKLNVSPYMTKYEGGIYNNVVDVYEKYVPCNTHSQFYE